MTKFDEPWFRDESADGLDPYLSGDRNGEIFGTTVYVESIVGQGAVRIAGVDKPYSQTIHYEDPDEHAQEDR